jgi:preprotein translocase subunit SecF
MSQHLLTDDIELFKESFYTLTRGPTMQNIDFYEKKNIRLDPDLIYSQDPEFYSRTTKNMPSQADKNRKKASRMIFFISALCIISFTAGIIIGIKFAGGTERQIVDRNTFIAISDIKHRVSSLLKEEEGDKTAVKNPFPKTSYPFVIKVNEEFDRSGSQKVARFLSQKGHTVILSKSGSNYKIYIGPYKSEDDAKRSMKKISSYSQFSLASNCKIMKR